MKKKIILGVGILIFIIIGVVIIVNRNGNASNEKPDKYDNPNEQQLEYKLVLLGDENITLNKDETYTEPGYYAILGAITVTDQVQVINQVDTSRAGEYEIIYYYKDVVKRRKITVIDNSKPIEGDDVKPPIVENLRIVLVGDKTINVTLGGGYQELGAKAYYGETDVSNDIKITNNINTKKVGTYTVTYTITHQGKTEKITRSVVVSEALGIKVNYNTNFTNKDVSVNIEAIGNYLYIKLPNGVVSTDRNTSYTIDKNGKYSFYVYDINNNYKQETINITNIDKEIPKGSCSVTIKDNKTSVNVSATDNIGIDYYMYNGSYKSTNNNYSFYGSVDSYKVLAYDKVGNVATINCNINKVASNIEMHFIVTTSDDDAILIRTNEATIMIDGGRYDKNQKVISYLNKIGVKKIDLLIGSHIQYNHVQEQGPIIDNFSVSKAIYSIDIKTCRSQGLCDSDDIKYVLDSINSKNIPTEVKYAGDFMQVGDMKLYFIGPLEQNKRHNKNSFVFILEHNGKKYMFTGDLETDDKKLFNIEKFNYYAMKLGTTLDVDFFKWPHHGINKVSDEFFKTTKPEYVLVPNFHGCSNLKKRSKGDSQMKKFGITYYELCDGVNVVLESDGKTIKMTKVSDPSGYKR